MTTIHVLRHLAKGEEKNGDKHIASVLNKAANEIEALAEENLRLNKTLGKKEQNDD